jgi:superfamily I DNA/RNA helicase
MQDVSKAQFDLVKLLFGDLGRLTVVGDDDQTIYGWRGASARLLLDFETVFPNASIVRLTTCFRCPPHVVTAMSRLIQNNRIRVKKSIRSNLAIEKQRKITIYGANSPEAEAVLMANDIAGKAGHGSIAVLFRTRRASSALIGELRKRRLHSTFSDRARFLEAPEVRLVLNVLQMCAGLSYDPQIVTDREVALLRERTDRSRSYLESDDEEGSIAAMPTPAAVSTVVSVLRLASDSLEFLQHEAEENAELRLVDFIDHVRLTAQQESGPVDGIHLSTVHQAKGLEWDYVYVIGATKGAWPGGSVTEDRIEEERRLFYVAMSRAKRELQMSFLVESGPSPFILELPEITIREKVQKPGDVERSSSSLPLSRHPAVFHSVRDISMTSARQLQLTSSNAQPPRPLRNIGPPRLTLIPQKPPP